MRDAGVVVVGAGVSGLAAAWHLTSAGADVVVLDAADRVGGPLLTGRVAGVTVDLGAESFLTRRPEALDLLRDLGLDPVPPAVARAGVRRDGTSRPLPPRTVFGVPSDAEALSGVLRPDEVARAREDRRLPLDGDVTVARLIGDRLGEAVVATLVDPLLGGVYAGSADDLSAAATLPQLFGPVRGGATVLEAARAVVAPPRTGTPAGPPFGGLDGGVGTLPVRLADALLHHGCVIRTATPVTAVSRAGPGWELELGGGGTVTASAVVLAVPPAAASGLLAATAPEAAAALAGVRCADVAVVAVAVPGGQVAEMVAGSSGLLVPESEARAEGLSVKAVTFASSKWEWIAGQDPSVAVLRGSVGRAGAPGASALDDEALSAAVRADLELLAGRPLDVLDSVVQRWPASLPQYAVGHRDLIGTVLADVTRVPGLAVAGAMLDGVGIPACIASGRAAARAIEEEQG